MVDQEKGSVNAGRFGRAALLGVAAVLLALGLLSGCSGGAGLLSPQETATPTSTPIPTETPGPSPTPDPVQADDIVYVRRYIFGLAGDLYLVHTNGLAPRQITAFTRDQASAGSDYPVWSPDHKAIAFSSEYRDLYNLAVWNLYKIDPEGQGAQQITGLPQPMNGYFPSVESKIPGVSVWAMMTPLPGVRVHGRVLTNGRPAAGALVVSWPGRALVSTDAQGNYTLENVPPGQRGWIKATAETGAGWVWVSPQGNDTAAPDILLDPRLGAAEYTDPAWDPRGGMWSNYRQHWFDPVTHDPALQTHLLHMAPDGTGITQVYTATNKTMGRPRANPAHPEQVAVVDGTDLLLLTVTLDPAAGSPVTARRVLRRDVLRNAPVAWSPDGRRLYYTQPTNYNSNYNAGYENLVELDMATDQTRTVTFFWPKEQENTGFDISPDGTSVVYEEYGDLFIRRVDSPASVKPRHITYYGQGLHPTWGGR